MSESENTLAISELTTIQKIRIGGSLAVIIGGFLPWVSVGTFSARGVAQLGLLTVLLGFVCSILSFRKTKNGSISDIVCGASGVLITVIGVLYFTDPTIWLTNVSRVTRAAANIGIGVYLTTAGGIGLTYGSYEAIQINNLD